MSNQSPDNVTTVKSRFSMPAPTADVYTLDPAEEDFVIEWIKDTPKCRRAAALSQQSMDIGKTKTDPKNIENPDPDSFCEEDWFLARMLTAWRSDRSKLLPRAIANVPSHLRDILSPNDLEYFCVWPGAIDWEAITAAQRNNDRADEEEKDEGWEDVEEEEGEEGIDGQTHGLTIEDRYVNAPQSQERTDAGNSIAGGPSHKRSRLPDDVSTTGEFKTKRPRTEYQQ